MSIVKRLKWICVILIWFAGTPLGAEETIESLKQKQLNLMSGIVSQLNREYSNGRCSIEEVINAEIRSVKLRRKLTDAFQDKGFFLKEILRFEERRLKVQKFELMAGSLEGGTRRLQRTQLRILSLKQKILEVEAKKKPDA